MLPGWMAFALVSTAPAADAPDEEVVVWADRFLRWEQRWYVETEIRLSTPITLLAWNTVELTVHALQVRAILSCDKDHPLGPNRMEVHCTLEDVAMVGLPKYPNLAHNLEVLEESVGSLKGSAIQLQVSAEGGVPNVDLEPVRKASNRRGMDRQERLRQVISRVILPFHVDLPDGARPGIRWPEYGSRLLSMPSEQGSAGSAEVVHYLDALDGHWLIQSLGRAVSAPTGGREAVIPADGDMLSVVGVPVDVFELELHGVAIVDPHTGIMTERTWVVGGGMTPSSPSFLTQQRYYHAGRFRMLGRDERPSVGATHLAYTPGTGHQPTWQTLAP